MDTKIIDGIAVINSETPLITDTQSVLDLIASVSYEHNVTRIAINKAAISDDFFKLSTGFAGEIVQKFVTYRCQLAIVGDFSGYTRKPLHDYMYECNKGKHLFFVGSKREAFEKMEVQNERKDL